MGRDYNLVIIAKDEKEMKEMMISLGRYIERKNFEASVEKRKLMILIWYKGTNEENKMGLGRKRDSGDKRIEIFMI